MDSIMLYVLLFLYVYLFFQDKAIQKAVELSDKGIKHGIKVSRDKWAWIEELKQRNKEPGK